jgi:hypothetical protein
MFNFLFSKKKIEGQAPPGKTLPALKSSTARIDSQVFHLYQWDGFGFILKPYKGDLVATQIFYPKITIELETDSITINASAEVLTVGEDLAAKWVQMTGAEARWLKRYMLRHGPGHNPKTVEPTTAEPDQPADGAPAAGEKSGTAPAAKAPEKAKK